MNATAALRRPPCSVRSAVFDRYVHCAHPEGGFDVSAQSANSENATGVSAEARVEVGPGPMGSSITFC
jgi:hypothetical protein